MIALVATDIDGVLDVEAVEGHGIFSDRTGEGVLQKPHLVIIDIDIGEDILEQGVEDIAGLDQLVDTFAALPEHDVLLGFRRFPVDML